MALNQQQADMLAQIMAALQEAAPAAGGQNGVMPGGVPPPGPPPPGLARQVPAPDSDFVSRAFWKLEPQDPQDIARELESYNEFLSTNPDAAMSVILGRASNSAFLSTKLAEPRPLLMHSLGIYGDMVTWSHFRGQFFGLTGDSYLDSPPPILWQRNQNLMLSDRIVRVPPGTELDLFYTTNNA
jgi:hypothetical protein